MASLMTQQATGAIEFHCLRQVLRMDPDQQSFRDFNMNVGIGRGEERRIDTSTTVVTLHKDINIVHSLEQLILTVFPDDDKDNWKFASIAAPLNSTVDRINNRMFERVVGAEKIYEAINTAQPQSVDPMDKGQIDAQSEHMARIDETGLPLQTLKLKVGMKVHFIKNIDVRYRLCNGTPAIIKRLHKDLIVVQRLEFGRVMGEEICVTRSRFERKPDPDRKRTVKFDRIQFPIRPSFGITLNKVQGQTCPRLGLALNTSVFAHGQLFVGLTRVPRAENLFVFNYSREEAQERLVINVVEPHTANFVIRLEQIGGSPLNTANPNEQAPEENQESNGEDEMEVDQEENDDDFNADIDDYDLFD